MTTNLQNLDVTEEVSKQYNLLPLTEKLRRLELVISAYSGWFIRNEETWKIDVINNIKEFEKSSTQ